MNKKLNLGSGSFAKKGYVNVDYRSGVGAQVVHDLNHFPYPFADNEFELAEADHVLEHLERPFEAMRELHRIVKRGGTIRVQVPHFSRGFTHPEHAHGFDVSLPLYFNPAFKGGYEGVEFRQRRLQLTWFAQRYLKKESLSAPAYYVGVGLDVIFSFFANLSPYTCSRLWCFWVGGFEQIEFEFEVIK